MTRQEEAVVKRLMDKALGTSHLSMSQRAVLEAAMLEAMYVTNECGTPEATDAAILYTFNDALQAWNT